MFTSLDVKGGSVATFSSHWGLKEQLFQMFTKSNVKGAVVAKCLPHWGLKELLLQNVYLI